MRLKVLWILDVIQLFLFTFSVLLTNVSSILIKYINLVNCSINSFISKDGEGLLNCSIRVFGLE